ncbi:MAG: hypothetical protein NXY57DRAFT_488949 [Lentinula lateritia]|nr:MAG: hypothetical protein NXY57DRAFT_488949 [Lentinula lateritia]
MCSAYPVVSSVFDPYASAFKDGPPLCSFQFPSSNFYRVHSGTFFGILLIHVGTMHYKRLNSLGSMGSHVHVPINISLSSPTSHLKQHHESLRRLYQRCVIYVLRMPYRWQTSERNQGVKHEGTPEGKWETIAGIESYVGTPSGEYQKDKVLLFLCDVFGPQLPNAQVRLLRPKLAPCILIWVNIAFGGRFCKEWFQNGGPRSVRERWTSV